MKKTSYALSVTQEDIDEGLQNHMNYCVVACAMRRAGFGDPEVGGATVLFNDRSGVRRRGGLDPTGRALVLTFDSLARVLCRPCTIEITNVGRHA